MPSFPKKTKMTKAKSKTNKTSRKNADVTPAKARKILKDGKVGGKALTKKQEGMFGAIAGKKK